MCSTWLVWFGLDLDKMLEGEVVASKSFMQLNQLVGAAVMRDCQRPGQTILNKTTVSTLCCWSRTTGSDCWRRSRRCKKKNPSVHMAQRCEVGVQDGAVLVAHNKEAMIYCKLVGSTGIWYRLASRIACVLRSSCRSKLTDRSPDHREHEIPSETFGHCSSL